MTAGIAWIAAFPQAQAERAVEAVITAWRQMTDKERAYFRPNTHESKLTRVITECVRQRVSKELRLSGHWGTEGVWNDVDFETGKILQEGRTDIEYVWNEGAKKLSLIFEFKKISANGASRKNYLFEGVLRFVTGIYSQKEPAAVMVGIAMSPREDTVRGLRRALANASTAAKLFACADIEGNWVQKPVLFPKRAEFDSEHLRTVEKAPAHGSIRIAHVFVEFPWVVHKPSSSRRRDVDDNDM